jgi:hypothetical protein
MSRLRGRRLGPDETLAPTRAGPCVRHVGPMLVVHEANQESLGLDSPCRALHSCPKPTNPIDMSPEPPP